MVKLKDLSRQEAERLQAEGKLLAEEIPRTETRWFNIFPVIRLFTLSADTRYEMEIRRLAKKHKTGAIYEKRDEERESVGAEFPYRLQFYRIN